MSDVPLGTFCSGGIDSGLVTGYAARHSSGSLHTFSVGFDEAAWDETPLARDTASRFGTAHHTIVARGAEFAELLNQLIRQNDEPLSHPNSLPLYVLSRFARDLVTVVLTGEGAGELFCGYPRYHIARLNAVTQHLPGSVRTAGGRVMRALPGHRAALLGRLLPRRLEDAVLYNSAYVEPDVVAALTGRPVDAAMAARRGLVRDSVVPGDPIASISRYELLTYLGCALERMDRMSMASGLESRVPLLDVELVEWALSLPSKFKISGSANKRIVKRLARRFLSARVVRGRKSGFGLPLNTWFRHAACAHLIRRLLDPAHPAASYIDRRVLDQRVKAHLSGRTDQSEVLWLVLNFYLWCELHLSSTTRPPGFTNRAATLAR